MKHIAHIIGIVLIAGIFFVLMVFFEENYILYDYVVPPASVTIEEWLESFRLCGTIGIGIALASSLLWYALGQWWFNLNNWRASGKRLVWLLLFLFPVAGIILGILLTSQAQEGAVIAYAFYVINGLACYYLATAFFSPSSFKYSPVGARKIRQWRLAF